MSETTNSAKHLYEILNILYENLKEVKRQEVNRQGHTSQMSALYLFSIALGTKGKTEKVLSDEFSNFVCLFRDVEEDIRNTQSEPEVQSIYIDTISKLKIDICSVCLSKDPKSWTLLYEVIDEKVLKIVNLCNNEIAKKGNNYNLLDSEEYDSLMQKLRELTDEFINSDLPTDIKFYLIGELRKIEKALIDIEIRGEGNLSNVALQIFGRAISQYSQNISKYKECFFKLISFAAQVNGSISLGEKMVGLPEAIQKLLPPR